jgi:tetratricopeptide (TPR) repeat protein
MRSSPSRERWPQIKATEPELLAHHYTEANQPEKAIPLWQQAGALSLKRIALAEAIAHLNKGLELIAALSASAERDVMELDLRTLSGTAWLALRGWPAQEVWDSLFPALGLANSLRRQDALAPILHGLFIHVLCRGRVADSLCWVAQMQEAAETSGDPDLLIVGHQAALTAYFWLGDLIKVRDHADQVLALYSEEWHAHLVGMLSGDLRTSSLHFLAVSTWMLGYPDRAAQHRYESEAHARKLGHPFDLGFTLAESVKLFDCRGEPVEQLKRVEEAERLARENSLPFLMEVLVPCSSGIALIRTGQPLEGTATLVKGIAAWEKGGGRTNIPYLKCVLAEGVALLGDLAGALDHIGEVITQIERPGWEERYYYAEALRIKGWLLALMGDPEGAERAYLASLDWARTQQAKSWELRTATSYARLMRDQGRVAEARELLAPIYGWFTEGVGTKDLKEARALLDELSSDQSLEMLASAPESLIASVPGRRPKTLNGVGP